MARTNESTNSGLPALPDQQAWRHFGDGLAGKIVASRMQGFYASGADYRDVAVDASGNLQLAANVSVDLGTVDQGTAGSSAWKVTDAALTDGTQRVGGTVAVTQSTSPWVVSNGGTFAVQAAATLAAETTKVIGTVNQGTSPWVIGGPAADAAAVTGNPVFLGGSVLASRPGSNLVDGNMRGLNVDSRGNLVVSVWQANGTNGMSVGNPGDGLSNQTGMVILGQNHHFDGVSHWDRWRGNTNVTTGDTGAKTTGTFSGATQTNYNARGAIITAKIGTVTGAVTTFQTGIQWSPDGGTTWLGLTALGANLTTVASGNTITWIVYPTNTSQAAGATPANLAPASGPTQLNVVNAALPRTWRWTMSLTVATSLALTEVDVNYIL